MTSQRTVMIALGGNALSPKTEAGTITQQFVHTKKSLRGVMHFVREGYNICITHGNGPQVGNLLMRNDAGYQIYGIPQMPLDICVAESQGDIGFMIERMLRNILKEKTSLKSIFLFLRDIL